MSFPAAAPTRSLLLALSVFSLLAGCHSSSTNPVADPTSPSAQAAKARAQMVAGAFNVGLVFPAGTGEAEGAFLAAEQLTQAGGVADGRAVNLVLLDNQDVPEGALDAKLLGMAEAGVQAILTATSGSSLRSLELAGPSGVLSVGSSSTSPTITTVTDGSDLLFRCAPSDAIQGDLLAELAIAEIQAADPGVSPTASILVQTGDAYAEGIQDRFRAGFVARGGTILEEIGFDASTADAAVAQAFDTTPARPHKVVLAALAEPDPGASAVIAWSAIGAPRLVAGLPPWAFPDAIVLPVFLENVPSNVLSDLDGTLGTSVSAGSGSRFDVFAAAYRARWGVDPVSFASNAYDAVALVALAAHRAFVVSGTAEPTGLDLAAHLRAVANAPGTDVEPGVTPLASGLAAIRSGADVNYQGAYAGFDLDSRGDIFGDDAAAYTVFRLDGAATEFVEVETRTIDIAGP